MKMTPHRSQTSIWTISTSVIRLQTQVWLPDTGGGDAGGGDVDSAPRGGNALKMWTVSSQYLVTHTLMLMLLTLVLYGADYR